MAGETIDFGVVDQAQASSVGLPGQRTFRLQFLNERGETACLWLEKEQLAALGEAIGQLIAQLTNEPAYVDLIEFEEGQAAEPEIPFPEPPTVEFKIGRLALGYDEGRGRFTLLMHDIEGDLAGAAGFRCLVTREQLERLSRQIAEVVAAGRPVCPLCNAPLTVGTAHFCPPSNGHAQPEG